MTDRGPGPDRPAHIERWSAGAHEPADDVVAAEEPLQIVLDGEPFAVVMRTPGHDLELVLGLLFAEGLILGLDDLAGAALAASGIPEGTIDLPLSAIAEAENLVDLRLARPRPDAEPVGWQRNLVAASACGICGAAALDALRVDLDPLPAGPTFSWRTLTAFPQTLREAQATFELTGGLHAAGLFTPDGVLVRLREDVGRHNAVDKLVGAAMLAGELPLHDRAVMVSGRTSFELAQKAVAAGVPLLAAVSAPSSLAIHVAHTFGLTLVGFLRGDRFNVYTGGQRIGAD
ncbi:MAG: formate dehydrogenase accessory sulfurtransferase FdhD [Candidatus Limnocylindrales bacterium]